MSFAVVSVINPPFIQAISRPGRTVESRDLKRYGDNCLRDGSPRLAAAQYLAALRVRPDYAEAMTNLAVAYHKMKDLNQAEQWYRKSLAAADPDSAGTFSHLAELELERGQFEEARRYSRLAQNAGFNPSVTWRLQAQAYVAERRWDDARQAYESALQADRDLTGPYRNMLFRDLARTHADTLNLQLAERDMERFDVTFLRHIQQTDPEISKTCNDIGVMYLYLGDTTRALERMKEAVTVWPRNETAQKNVNALMQIWKPSP